MICASGTSGGGATAPCGLTILYIILCRSCVFCLYLLLSFSFVVPSSYLISFFSFLVGMSGFGFSILSIWRHARGMRYVLCFALSFHCIGSRKWDNACIYASRY
jgi:hypothetical protein